MYHAIHVDVDHGRPLRRADPRALLRRAARAGPGRARAVPAPRRSAPRRPLEWRDAGEEAPRLRQARLRGAPGRGGPGPVHPRPHRRAGRVEDAPGPPHALGPRPSRPSVGARESSEPLGRGRVPRLRGAGGGVRRRAAAPSGGDLSRGLSIGTRRRGRRLRPDAGGGRCAEGARGDHGRRPLVRAPRAPVPGRGAMAGADGPGLGRARAQADIRAVRGGARPGPRAPVRQRGERQDDDCRAPAGGRAGDGGGRPRALPHL